MRYRKSLCAQMAQSVDMMLQICLPEYLVPALRISTDTEADYDVLLHGTVSADRCLNQAP